MATESPEKLNLNNPTEENPKETLDATVSPTDKPDRIEEEPTDDALIEPSVTTVDSDAGESEKTGEDSKSDVAAVASAAAAGDADDVSPASNIQKKIRRAERFGISLQLTEQEKRNSRAERFGTGSTLHGSDSEAFKKSEDLKRKARAERFGLRDSPVPSDEEAKKKAPSDEEAKKKLPSAEEAKKKLPSAEEAKKKARLARFSPVSETDALEEEKRKARMIRFSNPPTKSSSEVNGKGNMEPKTAIAGKAGGGV
uniref:THO1-MOS11 C-terminal domain-containing protein n=1 Tax=Fagus sylvatica TaxID=28930 RepID=A0A2N9IZ89_FAGSY